MPPDTDEGLSDIRNRAASFEFNLDSDRRKRLGQFFTGLPLSRVLAALSVEQNCTSVIDPMAGHGDLLDAVFERCLIEGNRLLRVDAIEVDSATAQLCRERMEVWRKKCSTVEVNVYGSSAFEPGLISTLKSAEYDLVITNPPYVRYQTVSENGRGGNEDSLERIRENLLRIVSERVPRREGTIWRELVRGFSGLSDLSVPAWLLAAMLVKPGGTLALVAPATWRTRDYADVLQYMLARCFKVKAVIADRQPGWFSEALVRTNLIVATRLASEVIVTPLCSRGKAEHEIVWAEVDQIAKQGDSLVGAAFGEEDPEGKFAQWLLREGIDGALEGKGISVTKHREDSLSNILSVKRSSSWLKHVEQFSGNTPLFTLHNASPPQWVPHDLKGILPEGYGINLTNLSKIGIQVSQGLRTGCNGFFYVEMIEQIDEKTARVLTSDMLGRDEIVVPIDALKSVLRDQSELQDFMCGSITSGYLFDLRGYVLPEDFHKVKEALHLYKTLGVNPPNIMPRSLADLVRRAAETQYGLGKGGKCGKRIPELSAVRTNARESRSGRNPKVPRFWYMLPDFRRRHLPDAFIPRINQDTPKVVANRRPPLLIDANFSTLWADGKQWTPEGIAGVLNCVWARACMEAIGTPMGGGALKIEATHLRRLPIPMLSNDEIEEISDIARNGSQHTGRSAEKSKEIDYIIVKAILGGRNDIGRIDDIIGELHLLTERLKRARQRC